MVSRRNWLIGMGGGLLGPATLSASQAVLPPALPLESIATYLTRIHGTSEAQSYARLLGAASEFKEGDGLLGVAAESEPHREFARQLLSQTTAAEINAQPVHVDDLYLLIQQPVEFNPHWEQQTLGDIKRSLLSLESSDIRELLPALSSDVISGLVKLMSNEELIAVSRKIFNPLPNSRVGAEGYLGARVQPNSPTDHPDDIFWQVLNAWSYGVGDVLLGTNPVSSEVDSVAKIEHTLKTLLQAFELEDTLPHCVLAHIDIQAQVEEEFPGSTALWFQSIAGSDTANRTFDITIKGMTEYARGRKGQYGLYFETGQGADFTNGHGHGFDMVMHESRKYGFARALKQDVAAARLGAGHPAEAWVILNDVAGFIGPEVFRSREQLVRCCLEDIVMGKLHGLCIGLDVCSTLHMDVSLDDLDWCLDQIMPANPAYLMALPTKIDPMLGYLTTGYQDHVRLRQQFGYRANDAMEKFFIELGVTDYNGKPGRSFGRPEMIYVAYQKKKSDPRSTAELLAEARIKINEVRSRGVFIAQGHGKQAWDLAPELDTDIQRIYADAKRSIWAEFPEGFEKSVPGTIALKTRSNNREHYILRPQSGEQLSAASASQLAELRESQSGDVDLQIVISDGLNALSITNEKQLLPFIAELRHLLTKKGYRLSPDNLLLYSGRVRAGYRIGEHLFAGLPGSRGVLHIIGERPGTGHDTFSAYITAPPGDMWARKGEVDHNITRVVSGVALTALKPDEGARAVVRNLVEMTA